MYKTCTFNQGLMTNQIGFFRGNRVQEKRREYQPKQHSPLHSHEKEHQKFQESDIAETHYATSDTLFFYQILLKQILQTEEPENCSPRKKSRLMSLLSLLIEKIFGPQTHNAFPFRKH